jgi:rubrerythrin
MEVIMELSGKGPEGTNFSNNTTFKEIVEFALDKERTAYNFFYHASQVVKGPGVQVMFRELANEEKKHIEWLQEPLTAKDLIQKNLAGVDIPDMELDKFVMEKEVTPDTTTQEALAMAIHWEERAKKFYEDAIKLVTDPVLKEVFQKLANFEQEHKLKLEKEYDNWVYKDN